MEYLPGKALVYEQDLVSAAHVFVRIHAFSHQMEAKNHLTMEKKPLTMNNDQCRQFLKVDFNSALAEPNVSDYLKAVITWAAETKTKEAAFEDSPRHCIINTEVNSSHFIINHKTGRSHLVDWEKPLLGDPSQDLSHFLVPTTTLWKTHYRINESDRKNIFRFIGNKFLTLFWPTQSKNGKKCTIPTTA